jgi:uncharacterized protein YegP (UPF0339 family)
MVYEDYLRCSDYEGQAPHASEAEFSAFHHEESQRHFFALLDATGKVLLKSEGYPQPAARENGIQSVIKNRGNSEFYSVKSYENGRFYVSLRAANHREIARSCSFETEAEALAELPYISGEKTRTIAAAVAAVTDTQRADNKVDDNYLACKEYANQGAADENGMIKFSHSNGEHYFVWVDGDGDVIMRSEGYPTTTARDNGYASVLKNRDNEDRYSVMERMGRYFVCLKAGNHQEIARSCPYDSEAGARRIFPGYRTSIVTEVTGETSAAAITTTTQGATETVNITDANAIAAATTTTQGTTESVSISGDAAALAAATITTAGISQSVTIDGDAASRTTTETVRLETTAETVTNITTVTETVQKVVEVLEDDYLPCREYQGRNVNDVINNISTFQHDNGQYYFVVYNMAGNVRLRSEGFDTDEERASELSAVIKHLENEDMYETITRGEYYIKVLKDETGREIGRSCLQRDEIEVIPPPPPPVVEVAAIAAVAAAVIEPPKVEKVVEVDVEDDYLPCKDYEGRTINDKVNNVAMFKHDNGQYYFAIYNADGKVRLRSEGFKTAQDRDKELSGALKNLNNKDMYSTIRRGNYWMAVLKDNKGREVGRSCLEKEEPVVVPVAPVAVAAVAAAAAFIPEKPKVVVETPKVEIPKVAYQAPVVEEVAEAASGFNWKWLLLLLPLLALWWFTKDGCNKVEPVVPAVTPVETPKVEAPAVVAPVGCSACTGTPIDDIFTSVCDNPKKLSRLGTNPEFGNSHALSPTEFYEKLKKAHANNDVDKVFLERIYKAMGYTSFADAKPEHFSAVVLPVGTSGKLGYSKLHKTGCYTLPDDEYHRKAFHIKSANGCDLHFMKTCGNHFFFCAK